MTTRPALRSARGFSLIESLIYIFLFSLIVGGGISTAYFIYESTAHSARQGAVENDADFLLRKLDWAGIGSTITAPALGASGSTLTYTRDGTTYSFTHSGTDVLLATNGGTPVVLTTANGPVTAFSATYTDETAPIPDSLSVTLTMKDKVFGPKIIYVR